MEAQAERASSHDRILYAAKQLFARQGYLQTATAQVARQAETSESQLIKHFGSKEGLLEAIFEGVWRGLNEQVRHLTAAYPDPAKRLKALTNLMVDAMESDAELKRLMLFEGRRIRTHGATVTAGFRQFVDTLDGLLKEAKKRGVVKPRLSLPVLRSMLMGAFEGLLRDQQLATESGYPAMYTTKEIRKAVDLMIDCFLDESPGPKSAPKPKK